MSGSLRHQAFRGAALMSYRQVLVGAVTLGGIVALPLLLGPAEFSLYGYANTTILVAAALGDLGLGAYLIKSAASDRDVSGSFALQLAFWIPVSALLLLVGVYFQPFGFSATTSTLLALTLLLLALQTLPTAMLEKRMAFKRISMLEVCQRVLFIGAAIALAGTHPSQWSIPLAVAISALAGYPAFLLASRWRWRPRFTQGEPLFRGFSSEWWQVRIANQAAYATFPLLGGLLFTASEVGLIVWALAITSIPTYLAPMIARATFPALSRAATAERVAIYSGLFRALLLVGMPMIAALIAAADPLTRTIFGSEWVEGITLLRLQSVAAAIGLFLTPLPPLLFLTYAPKRIKWISTASTLAIILVSLALAPIVDFLAITIATILCTAVTTIVFDRALRRVSGYSPLKDMAPALVGAAIGSLLGYLVATAGDGLAILPAAMLTAAAVQLALTYLLGGGIDPRQALASIRRETSAQAGVE